MATVPTPPIAGALTGFIGATGTPVAYFAESNTLEGVQFTVLVAPSGGTSVIQINTAADGSGSKITVTIADGENIGTASGSVGVPAGSCLDMIVGSDSGGSVGLSGFITGTAASGVSVFLTTLQAVKLDADISGTDADRDTVLNSIIAGVSKRIQNWIHRPIVQTTATDEKIDSIGDYKVQTRHYPIISISALTESGTALVEDTDFEIEEQDKESGQIIRISGDDPIAWVSGRRVVKLTYVHGFAAVPDDLVRIATELAVLKYNETQQSTLSWRGLLTKGVDPAAAFTYDKDFWAREVVPVLEPYRRMVA